MVVLLLQVTEGLKDWFSKKTWQSEIRESKKVKDGYIQESAQDKIILPNFHDYN